MDGRAWKWQRVQFARRPPIVESGYSFQAPFGVVCLNRRGQILIKHELDSFFKLMKSPLYQHTSSHAQQTRPLWCNSASMSQMFDLLRILLTIGTYRLATATYTGRTGNLFQDVELDMQEPPKESSRPCTSLGSPSTEHLMIRGLTFLSHFSFSLGKQLYKYEYGAEAQGRHTACTLHKISVPAAFGSPSPSPAFSSRRK